MNQVRLSFGPFGKVFIFCLVFHVHNKGMIKEYF